MKVLSGFRRFLNNRRGSVFVMVLLLLLILSVLGMSMLGLAASNLQMSNMDRNYQSVFYIAESGREQEVRGLCDVIEQVCDDSDNANEFYTAMDQYFTNNYPKEIEVFDEQFGQTIVATVSVEGIGDWNTGDTEHTYTLVSEGDIGGVKRKVASDINLKWKTVSVPATPPPTGGEDEPLVEDPPDVYIPNVNVALFSLNNITMTGSACINGPVGTNVTQAGGVSFGWSNFISGNMYISPDADPNTVFSIPQHDTLDAHFDNLVVMEEEPVYPLPGFPATPNLPLRPNEVLAWNHDNVTINQDGHYNLIQTNSYTLNIYVGSGVRKLVVDNFIINGSGRVNVIGSGMLKLYVTDTFTLSGSSTFNTGGDASKVILYYSGTDTFQVDGATQFVGNVYVHKATVNITGSGGVTGHIVTGGSNVNISGNASAHVRMIYAPKATVTLTGSGHVRGAVVAKQCVMSGGTWITYDANADLGDFPGVIGGGNTPGGGVPGTGGPGGSPGGGYTVDEAEVIIDIGKLTELDYQ